MNFYYLIVHWWGNLRFLPFSACRILHSPLKFEHRFAGFMSGFLLGINVYWRCFQQINTFQDFVTCRFNLVHFIYSSWVLMAFGAPINFNLWTLWYIWLHLVQLWCSRKLLCIWKRAAPQCCWNFWRRLPQWTITQAWHWAEREVAVAYMVKIWQTGRLLNQLIQVAGD